MKTLLSSSSSLFPSNIYSRYSYYCSRYKLLSLFSFKHTRPSATPAPRWTRPRPLMATTNTFPLPHLENSQKIVVILGATGSGKSKLSIDLATRFFPSEIINSDKIQVLSGLDVTTNKIPMHERRGVPHHLLGEFRPSDSHIELTPSEFRSLASSSISGIVSRQRLPLVVGGSNSFIYALCTNRFNPDLDVFNGTNPDWDSCKELRYKCCFLWVDVSLPVLNQYLCKRVDDMLESGMLEELDEYYKSEEFHSMSQNGLKKAIGVPEFEKYFKTFGSHSNSHRTVMVGGGENDDVDGWMEKVVYEEAVRAIKDNTCRLAKRQLGKIQRLKDLGWDLQKIDATEVFRASMSGVGLDSGRRGSISDVWERQVVQPSVKIVKRFLAERLM